MSWDTTERREFVRTWHSCKITIRDPNGKLIPSYAENVSAGGIRAILEKKLKSGSVISLKISGIKKKPIVCQGNVRWVFTRKSPGKTPLSLYDTGIEFCKIKPADVKAIKTLITFVLFSKK